MQVPNVPSVELSFDKKLEIQFQQRPRSLNENVQAFRGFLKGTSPQASSICQNM